jgi:arginase
MPQPIDIITLPYDSGRRDWRMGAGPAAILDKHLVDTLVGWGHDARVIDVEARDGGPAELLAATMELLRTVSHRVRDARAGGRFPIVLTGNCIATVGAVAAVEDADPAVAWLDAHGDLNTPRTSASGFLDGMAAAMLLGWCHVAATSSLDGFRALPLSRFLLVGARDLDRGEAEAVQREGVRALTPPEVAEESTLGRALDDVIAPAGGVWLHIDLDVLDPAPLAPANAMTPPGGLSLYDAVRVVQECVARGRVLGLTLSAYDPAGDPHGLLPAAVRPLISEALEGA